MKWLKHVPSPANKKKDNKKTVLLQESSYQNEDIPEKTRSVQSHTISKRTSSDKSASLKHKLQSSKFRWLNEKLYTTTSKESFELFKKSPNLFPDYHQGFTNQVILWPENPLDRIIGSLKEDILKKSKLLEKSKNFDKEGASLVIADMGCGEAKLYDELKDMATVHSFDLVSQKPHVVACDISKVKNISKFYCLLLFIVLLCTFYYNYFIFRFH